MPRTTDIPEGLRPYFFHGISLEPVGGDQARGGCALCGRDAKFYANTVTGLWECKKCGASGNPLEFMRQFYESCVLPEPAARRLADERGLLDPATLAAWGVKQSTVTDDYLLPGWATDGRLLQLYRYAPGPQGKRVLMATPTLGHGLLGVPLYNAAREHCYVCEGPWDGAALWEALGLAKLDGDKLAVTGNPALSLLADANVLAVPGCNVWNKAWSALLGEKTVYLAYDNDYPRRHPKTAKPQRPAARAGVIRTAGLISEAVDRPAALYYLQWDPKGKDHAPGLPDGHDVRDHLRGAHAPEPDAASEQSRRVYFLQELLGWMKPVPPQWVPGRAKGAPPGCVDTAIIPCTRWPDLQNSWRKAMKWTDGLDRTLSVMLACVISTDTVGEQLWVKVMGPPSSGKTTLCEALSVAKDYVYAKSTIRGFHSGYKSDKEGKDDHSLIPKLRGKTLVLKDGDTLLQLPNRDQVLSEARDLYDGVSRAHYRHGVDRNYEHVRVTFILCGTGALRFLDQSELGARFLDCLIMEGIDPDFERDVNRRVVFRALRNVKVIMNGEPDTQADPAMVRAKGLTGGYVEYLRKNARVLLATVEVTEEQAEYIITLGEFVAMMRARPSNKQDEVTEREFSSRLVEQYARLTTCLAAVMDRKQVDPEVMRRVRQVAIDTSRGRTLNLVQLLHSEGERGGETKQLAVWAAETDEKCRRLLHFLQKIHAVERFEYKPLRAAPKRLRWRLTERMHGLYEAVMGTGM